MTRPQAARMFSAALLLLLAAPCVAAGPADRTPGYSGSFTVGSAKFAADGERMTVTTPALKAEFRGMTLVQVTDVKRGVSYLAAEAAPAANTGCEMRLVTYKPGVANPRLLPFVPEDGNVAVPQTRTSITRLADGLRCEVRGLGWDGGPDPNRRQFYADAVIGIDVSVDANTGDLLIHPFARTGVERKFGVYDEGLDSVTFTMGTVRPDANFLLPRGVAVRSDKQIGAPGNWPNSWLCPLLIVQEPAGERCLSLWAEDRSLLFGKRCSIGPLVSLTSLQADAPWKVASSRGPTWRLNVFNGWMPAARVYRDLMAETYGLKPIEQQSPDWASHIRVICWDVYNTGIYQRMIDAGCPPESILDWRTQGWMRGYGKYDLTRPNWPLDNPTHFEARDPLIKMLPGLKALGVKTFPYTILFYELSPKWIQRMPEVVYPGTKRTTGAGRLWWVLYTNLCEQIIADYDMAGIYDDVSWIAPGGRDPRGYVDGMNVYQSHVAGRKYMRSRLPDRGWMGERQHEITVVSDHVALLWRRGVHHPINAFLFSPYSIRWNQQTPVYKTHAALDADETLGLVAVAHRGMPGPAARDFDAVIRARTLEFCRQQIVPAFPEKYEPHVRFYYRGKSGVTYKVVEDRGVRFSRFDPNGRHEVYWRVHGASDLPTNLVLPDWVAYGPDGLIGLEASQWYVLAGEHERPPAVIRSMPAGAHVTMSKVLPDGWIVRLSAGGADPNATTPLKLAVTGPMETKLTFVGASAVAQRGPGLYEVTVPAGQQLACLWRVPQPASVGSGLPEGTVVRSMGPHGLPAGVSGVDRRWPQVWVSGGQPHVDAVLTLPAEPLKLQVSAARITGEKPVTYRVLINGRPVAQAVRKGDEKSSTLEASLRDFAGQTVVLTLICESPEQPNAVNAWTVVRLAAGKAPK